ncbi:hypothetical protein I4U23_030243 [Adineta vaga]|nr:hypothetical protein I4U23_030243 [Adineta vaga]
MIHNKSKLNVDISTSKSDGKIDDDKSENEPMSRTVKQHSNTNDLKLFSRIWYCMKLSAKKSYSACSLAGEKIAWFFGITKPKYHAELQKYDRMNEEEREAWRQAFQDIEHTDDIRDSIR